MADREGMDSDEDDFVSFGTALQPFKEDGLPRRPVPVQEQPLQDARGRAVRFHGAFTGGFSAGYFNTVGSKEGWKPSTFSSSRSGEPERQKQNIEDFMDAEDFSEHGIAPRRITTTDNFTAKSVNSKSESLFEGVIPGNAPLQDLVTAAELSIGIRLLRKLGWKEGQGIGPRVKRKRKKRRKPATESSQKIYGCALPPSPGHLSEESDDYEDFATDVGFAPKDVNPISFVAKDNMHGIGYSGIQSTNTLGQLNLFDPKPISRSGKKGITGRAFGVGALEKDDDDIYALDSMQNYDFEMGGPDESKTHGWTAPSNTGSHQKPLQFPDALPGFKMASSQLKQKKVYKPPQLPRHFRPFHVFRSVEQIKTAATSRPGEQSKQLDANTRRGVIDDPPTVKSVFDLISDADKKKLDSIQKPSLPASVALDETSRRKDSTVSGETSRSSTGDITGSMTGTPVPSTSPLVPSSWKPVTTTGQSFKPFERDPSKQTRYETYSALMKQGHKDAYSELETSHMTEWEKQREREEFTRSTQLYRPLSFMMASRFTRAKYDDDTDNDQAEDKVEESDQAKAAKMNLFGKLTRETFEWHPDKLICRRFNVPNPYPESTIVGLHKDNREKMSVFNFLNFSYEQNPEPQVSKSENTDKPQTPELKGQNVKGRVSKGFKPLSILASTDLTARLDPSSDNATQSVTGDATSHNDKQQSGAEDSAGRESDEEARPPMDLFKAIFSDTDASDSSQEEEDEEQTDPSSSLQTVENNMQLQVLSSEGVSTSKSSEEQIQSGSIEVVSLEERLSPVDKSVIYEDHNKEAATSVTDAVKVFAGPALPPSFNINATPVRDPGKEEKPTSVLERYRDEHRKQKHRHKDRHRHKHSKKSSKYKRDKHKKKKDKKKKKKKVKEKVINVSSESDDMESADDSSSDDNFPTDKNLLEKFRSVKT